MGGGVMSHTLFSVDITRLGTFWHGGGRGHAQESGRPSALGQGSRQGSKVAPTPAGRSASLPPPRLARPDGPGSGRETALQEKPFVFLLPNIAEEEKKKKKKNRVVFAPPASRDRQPSPPRARSLGDALLCGLSRSRAQIPPESIKKISLPAEGFTPPHPSPPRPRTPRCPLTRPGPSPPSRTTAPVWFQTPG